MPYGSKASIRKHPRSLAGVPGRTGKGRGRAALIPRRESGPDAWRVAGIVQGMAKASGDPRARPHGGTASDRRCRRGERDVDNAPLVRALHARRRDRERIERATQDTRDAFVALLGTCPPWAAKGSTAHAFGAVQDQLDAGVAFGAVGHAVEPEVQLRRIAVGTPAHAISERVTPSGIVEARLARFTTAYAQPVATVAPVHLVARRGASDLADLADAVRDALGPWARVRPDERYAAANEVAWLTPRPASARARASVTLRGLATLGRRSDLDPLLIAAIAYARVLLARPFLHGNEAAGLVAVDVLLRATPGLSAARVGLGMAFRARRDELRASLRASVLGGEAARIAWLETFLRTVAGAARQTHARACAHEAGHAAVRERLAGPGGQDALDRRRIDGRELADLAARTPYLSIGAIVRAGLARERTAGRYLTALARLGLGSDVRWGRVRLLRVSVLADAVAPPAGRPTARHPAAGPTRTGTLGAGAPGAGLPGADSPGERLPGAGLPGALLRAAARRAPPIDPEDP